MYLDAIVAVVVDLEDGIDVGEFVCTALEVELAIRVGVTLIEQVVRVRSYNSKLRR